MTAGRYQRLNLGVGTRPKCAQSKLGIISPGSGRPGFEPRVTYNSMITKAETFQLLHGTLGHVAVQRIEDSISSGHIDWCHKSRPTSFKKLSEPCVVRQLAKSKRSGFSGKQPVITYPGQHWYMDVWGPDDIPLLLNLHIYTVGFRDEMSDAIRLYHVKSKDAVLDCLKDMYDKVIQPKRVNDGFKAFTYSLTTVSSNLTLC